MRIAGTKESLDKLQCVMDTHSKAYYTRFGDGDLLLMSNDIPRTKNNRQDNSAELRAELKESININDPLFLRAVSASYPLEPGMVDGLFAPFGNKEYLDTILDQFIDKINQSELYLSHILFHYLGVFKPQVLTDFVNKYIRPYPKMFVGSCNKASMEGFFGDIKTYVETPAVNSYATIDNWWKEIEDSYEDVKVIILATGNTSRIIAKRLWNINANVHCIDIGSIVDPIDNKFDTRTCWKMAGKKVYNYFGK
jgi:hypothetical protein